MACRVSEILMIIKTKIPSIFQEVIDDCKRLVEDFELRLVSIQNETEVILDNMTYDTLMSGDTLKRFKEDQSKAVNKFKEETEKGLRTVSEKALSKIRDLNKKSQEIVNAVVDFQKEVKEKISDIIEHCSDDETMKLSDAFRDLAEPLHVNFSKIKREVDRITKILPKKMEGIYSDLQSDLKKLEQQSDCKINAIVEKYKRLTEL